MAATSRNEENFDLILSRDDQSENPLSLLVVGWTPGFLAALGMTTRGTLRERFFPAPYRPVLTRPTLVKPRKRKWRYPRAGSTIILRPGAAALSRAGGGEIRPLRGETEEIGEAVAWLCSERASYVTGLLMRVDGGFMAQ
jgi:NAD(P)-dependent dehydrogenase (short-subunit alcohol dehydrogenase family)